MSIHRAFVPGDPLPWHYKYEHMSVTTDCVVFTYEEGKLKVLLVQRGGEPYKGMWAFPGGFLNMDENAEQGALRELREETGLKPSAIGQLGVFSDVDRDPRERTITIAWYALVKPSRVVGGDDAAMAAWFPIDGLPPLAFDHRKIFEAAMEHLRRDMHFQPVAFDLLDEEFTIPDLQCLYEAILGVTFDRRVFKRRILTSGILEEAESLEGRPLSSPTAAATREPRQGEGRTVPAGTLFRLNRKRYEEMKEGGGRGPYTAFSSRLRYGPTSSSIF